MKKLLIAMLFAAVLVAQASPLRAQYYSSNDALNKILKAVDSTATAAYAPTPVAVTPAFPIFSGYEMIAGASTATVFNKTRRTSPITGGMPLDGAKAVLLQFNWLRWAHGGFAFQPIYATSSADTGAASYSPTIYSLSGTASWADSIALDDSTTAGFVPVVDNGNATVRLPIPPGAGYLFIRVWPHAYAGIHIHAISCTARKVE